MKDGIMAAAVLLVILIAMGIVGRMDYEDFLKQREIYCDGRAIWEEQKELGIPAELRNGFPPYRESYYECD